jgi:hypothetical protein
LSGARVPTARYREIPVNIIAFTHELSTDLNAGDVVRTQKIGAGRAGLRRAVDLKYRTVLTHGRTPPSNQLLAIKLKTKL